MAKMESALRLKAYYKDFDRDYFSLCGYSYFLDNLEENIFSDCYEVYEEYTEYGKDARGLKSFIIDFYEVLPFTVWYKSNAAALSGLCLAAMSQKWIADLSESVARLENVTRLKNGNYLSKYTPFFIFD